MALVGRMPDHPGRRPATGRAQTRRATKMKIRRIALAAVAVLLPGLAFAAPAGAADTVATFSITAGGLAVTVPSGTVALTGATAAAGSSSVAGTLGTVSVADTRG